ncbi:MAG TPA: hypothetical protein VLM42_00615 [Bryobacteraceae bacterium]|nr:hypothetical protein [Bryobacteraceae bacterium]
MEFLSWLENTEFCTWIRGSGSIWAYPLVLTLHTTGMGILVGFNWALDLRLLGVARQVPVLAMEKFFKVMWIGFWVNLVTGIVLLAADATTKMTSWVFGVKMFFIVLAMIVLVKMEKTVFKGPASARQSAGGTASSASPLLQTSAQTSRTGLQTAAVLEPSLAGEAQFLPANAKLLAILSLVFWTISITAGRLMAYLGPQTGIK